MRAEVAGADRVVVKVGSSSLTRPDGHLDPARVAMLARVLSALHGRGVRVVLVTSGAIAAALGPLGLRRRPRDLETQQAAAAVGQGLLIRHYSDAFAEHGVTVAQLLLTVEDVLRPSSASSESCMTASEVLGFCRPMPNPATIQAIGPR